MYTLYSQQSSQSLRWIADTATEERARKLARLQSKFLPEPVVIVRRFEDDATDVVATFRNGQPQALDAS